MTANYPVHVVADRTDPLPAALMQVLNPALVVHVNPTDFTSVTLSTAHIVLGAPHHIAQVMPHCPNLIWAQSTWAGVNPLLMMGRRDYVLTALKGVFGQSMAEYAMAWLLAYARGVLKRSHQRHWSPQADEGLAGKLLGIMGTGSIGAAIAVTAKHFGMQVRGLNTDGRSIVPFDSCYPIANRRAFADGLDAVISVLPATPQTDRLIDESLLSRLAPGALLINVGRGNVVDDAALLRALDDGLLQAAILDVFEQEPLPEQHPFWTREDVIVTSHTAAPTPPAAAVSVFMENYWRFTRGEPLLHRVDFDRGY